MTGFYRLHEVASSGFLPRLVSCLRVFHLKVDSLCGIEVTIEVTIGIVWPVFPVTITVVHYAGYSDCALVRQSEIVILFVWCSCTLVIRTQWSFLIAGNSDCDPMITLKS